MRDILPTIEEWRARGERVAIATVVKTLGSAPRSIGAKMAVSSSGGIAGSVSGGCIEGAVFDACRQALSTEQACLLHFGFADEQAWEVGLSCGGVIDVFVEPFEATAVPPADGQPMAVATIIDGAGSVGSKLLIEPGGTSRGELGAELREAEVVRDALTMLARGENGTRTYATARGEVQLFIESYAPPATLLIVGAVHIAIPLVHFAKTLGFRCVVIDARGAFATEDRFAHADEIIIAWPDEALPRLLTENSFVVLLTHDPKLDDPALMIALKSPARYIGALGSTRTHAKRLDRLRTAGLTEEQIARIHAPIGLPIGANTPEEIAVSIIAEIIAARHGVVRNPS